MFAVKGLLLIFHSCDLSIKIYLFHSSVAKHSANISESRLWVILFNILQEYHILLSGPCLKIRRFLSIIDHFRFFDIQSFKFIAGSISFWIARFHPQYSSLRRWILASFTRSWARSIVHSTTINDPRIFQLQFSFSPLRASLPFTFQWWRWLADSTSGSDSRNSGDFRCSRKWLAMIAGFRRWFRTSSRRRSCHRFFTVVAFFRWRGFGSVLFLCCFLLNGFIFWGFMTTRTDRGWNETLWSFEGDSSNVFQFFFLVPGKGYLCWTQPFRGLKINFSFVKLQMEKFLKYYPWVMYS